MNATKKDNGATFALYNAGEDYARTIQEMNGYGVKPERAKMAAGFYAVAIGEKLPPESETVWFSEDGRETTDELHARAFDSYGDALKWAVENCEITNAETPPPRGWERPRYPRVCFCRVFTEIERL